MCGNIQGTHRLSQVGVRLKSPLCRAELWWAVQHSSDGPARSPSHCRLPCPAPRCHTPPSKSRGVAILPGVGFVSGSHDCSLRVWSLEGDVLAELLGHSAIIYHVAATDSGLIASGVCGGADSRTGQQTADRTGWRAHEVL